MPTVDNFFISRSALRSLDPGRFACRVYRLQRGERRLVKLGGVKLDGKKNDGADMVAESIGENVLHSGRRSIRARIFHLKTGSWKMSVFFEKKVKKPLDSKRQLR